MKGDVFLSSGIVFKAHEICPRTCPYLVIQKDISVACTRHRMLLWHANSMEVVIRTPKCVYTDIYSWQALLHTKTEGSTERIIMDH